MLQNDTPTSHNVLNILYIYTQYTNISYYYTYIHTYNKLPNILHSIYTHFVKLFKQNPTFYPQLV